MPAKQVRAICFTLNNPEGPLEWPEYTRYGVYQLERGKETGTPHFQGYAEFHKLVTFSALKKWLPTAHFEAKSKNSTRDQARVYCMKEDTRVDGPWEHGIWETQQGKRTDLEDAIETLKTHGIRRVAQEHPAVYVKFHKGLRELAAELEELPTDKGFRPRKWQDDLLASFSEEPDDRTIIWVYDPLGNMGKSRLVKHLVLEHDGVLLEGKVADMAFMYHKQRIACFDVSRAAAEHTDHLYSFAEKLKNGMLVSTKYMSTQKVFNPPHVVFMSNQMYEQGKWSVDRVRLIDLSEDYEDMQTP